MIKKYTIAIGLLMVIAATTDQLAAQSTGFQIETDVTIGDDPKPVQTSLTIFNHGIGYDVSLDNPNEITMVDPERDRIIRFHKSLQIRTELKISALQAMVVASKTQGDPIVAAKVALFVEGAERVSASEDIVQVGNELLKYEATLQKPAQPEFAKEYREFADATKQLNSFSTGGNPPYARLALNEAIEQKGMLPDVITMTAKPGKEAQVIKCRLHANWRLSKADEARITEIGKMFSFEEVDQAEYQSRVADSERLAALQSEPVAR